MGIFNSFFGRKDNSQTSGHTVSVSLQLLFDRWPDWDKPSIENALHGYDASLKSATVESVVQSENGGLLAIINWRGHKIQLVGFNLPMPAEAVEACVAPSHYDAETKAKVRAHSAHALLFCETSPQQVSATYTSLGLIAGALLQNGGLALLNEAAQTSLPAAVFTEPIQGMTQAQLFHTLPPLYLFAGFVKFQIEDVPGVWMTTRGLHVWGLPNLATLAQSHEYSSQTMDIFSNVASYMMSKGPVLAAGHTMQIGDDLHMRLREPDHDEEALTGGHSLLIAEFITADQINSQVYSG